MSIFVPSYRRPKSIITADWLPNTTYVVHEFEAKDYKKSGVDVLVCPDSKKGNITRVRNWIVEYALSKQIREFLILDDDVEYIFFWDKDAEGKWIHVKLTGDRTTEFFEMAFDMARDWGVHLWGVNCATDKQAYRENTPFALKSYISGSLHGLIDPVTRYDEALPLKEDYDYCIQELNVTRAILRFNMLGMMKKDHGNLGGCADYRTIQREAEQMYLLRKKWGDRIIRKDEKQSRTHRKKGVLCDINPIFRVPIDGV